MFGKGHRRLGDLAILCMLVGPLEVGLFRVVIRSKGAIKIYHQNGNKCFVKWSFSGDSNLLLVLQLLIPSDGE